MGVEMLCNDAYSFVDLFNSCNKDTNETDITLKHNEVYHNIQLLFADSDASASSGTLIEKQDGNVTNYNAGTWEYKTFPNNAKVLIIKPNDQESYENRVFQEVDGILEEGWISFAGEEYEGYWFDEASANSFINFFKN